MAKINTHGFKMIGLKKASGNTENYPTRSGMYNELFYDVVSGEVWTVFQCSLGHNSWTEYHDSNVRKICNTDEHMTMQEIADMIRDNMNMFV